MMPSSIALAPTAARRSTRSSSVGGAEQRRRVVERRPSPKRCARSIVGVGVDVERRRDEHDARRRRRRAERVGRGRERHEVLRAAQRGRPRSASPARAVARERRVVRARSSRASCPRTTSASSASCPPAAASSGRGEHGVEERTGQRRRGRSPRATIASSIAPSPWPPALGGHDEAEVAHLGELPPLRRLVAARRRAP